jgi:hypothetical protein
METLNENIQFVNLAQALLGAITPNFRVVTFECKNDKISIWFLLAEDDPSDREEIEDIVVEFEALQTSGVDLSFSIIISQEPLMVLRKSELPGRMVFARKEQDC